jgi:hypothetical protein
MPALPDDVRPAGLPNRRMLGAGMPSGGGAHRPAPRPVGVAFWARTTAVLLAVLRGRGARGRARRPVQAQGLARGRTPGPASRARSPAASPMPSRSSPTSRRAPSPGSASRAGHRTWAGRPRAPSPAARWNAWARSSTSPARPRATTCSTASTNGTRPSPRPCGSRSSPISTSPPASASATCRRSCEGGPEGARHRPCRQHVGRGTPDGRFHPRQHLPAHGRTLRTEAEELGPVEGRRWRGRDDRVVAAIRELEEAGEIYLVAEEE